jgi:hypothetical protein
MKVFIVISFALCLGSCCTKKGCPVEFGAIEIYDSTQTGAFQKEIVVYSYERGKNFVSVIDSNLISATKRDGIYTTFAYLMLYRDYKIKVSNTGKEYKITDIQAEKKGCNTCFPFRPQSDFYDDLKAYKLDGKIQTERTIRIYN